MSLNSQTTLQKGDGFVHIPSFPAAHVDTRSTVFLDRDGVLNEEVGYLRNPAFIRVLPGVPEALRLLSLRFRLVVVTNQSGIGRGIFTEDDLLTVHQHLADYLASEQVQIEAFYFCPHHHRGMVTKYITKCNCRKPQPGMLQRASVELGLDPASSYIVGDNLTDLQAGSAAGCKALMVGENNSQCPGYATATESLLEAAEIILAGHPVTTDSPPCRRNTSCSR